MCSKHFITRKSFISLAAASLTLAFSSGCSNCLEQNRAVVDLVSVSLTTQYEEGAVAVEYGTIQSDGEWLYVAIIREIDSGLELKRYVEHCLVPAEEVRDASDAELLEQIQTFPVADGIDLSAYVWVKARMSGNGTDRAVNEVLSYGHFSNDIESYVLDEADTRISTGGSYDDLSLPSTVLLAGISGQAIFTETSSSECSYDELRSAGFTMDGDEDQWTATISYGPPPPEFDI